MLLLIMSALGESIPYNSARISTLPATGTRIRTQLPQADVKENERWFQAALTAMRADRERGLAFTVISTSCPRATRNRMSRSTEKPSSL